MPFHRPKTRNPLPRRKHLARQSLTPGGARVPAGTRNQSLSITYLRHFFCTGTLRSVRSIWRCIHGLYVLITCALRCAVQFGTTPRSRKALNTSLILPQPFGGGKGETGFATLARDGRFQPYTGVPDGLHSLTWQRVRR